MTFTDHLPNFLFINKFSNLPKDYKLCDYSKLDETELISEVQTLRWEEIM